MHFKMLCNKQRDKERKEEKERQREEETKMKLKSEGKRRLYTKRPTIWIDLTSQFQCIRGGQVRVGRGHCEDEGVWIGDKGQDHLLHLSLDVLWLVSNRNLRQ